MILEGLTLVFGSMKLTFLHNKSIRFKLRGDYIQEFTKENTVSKLSLLSLALTLGTAVWLLTLFIEDKMLEKTVSEKLEETYGTEDFSIQFVEELSKDSILVSYQLEGNEPTFISFYERDNGHLVLVNTRELEE
ncbi:hypothetical protein ACQCVK_13850 [Rossellomorea vietnamensis]